jgi:hypothetical protein
MAARWGASADELTETAAPTVIGSSSQPSAVAVNAAHVDVAILTAGLAGRVGIRADHIADADTRYLAGDAHSTNELAALADSPTVV